MESSLWTEKEVSEYLKIALTTLQRWRSQKYGPPWIKLPTGAVRYNKNDVKSWAQGKIKDE